MHVNFRIAGTGHAFGSRIISNGELATSLNLAADWFEERTGIHHRRGCAEGEDVIGLGQRAVTEALGDAGLEASDLGPETLILCIQNGWATHMTPPPSIILCHRLGLDSVRTMAIDGVCAEPINALELAGALLSQNRCQRVIIVAAVDFLRFVDPQDTATAGLFGAGAGAMIMEADASRSLGLRGLYLRNQIKHWDLGVIPITRFEADAEGVTLRTGFYEMKGQELAKIAMKSLPATIDCVLRQAGWRMDDVDLLVTHQPNLRLLEVASKLLRIPRVHMEPVAEVGNIGPASILASLSIARRTLLAGGNKKLLLVSFGLGFSSGAAALQL